MIYIAGIFALYKFTGLPTDLTGVELYSQDFWMLFVNTAFLNDIAACFANFTSAGITGIKNYFLRRREKSADLAVRDPQALSSELSKISVIDEPTHPSISERLRYLASKQNHE